MTNKNADVHSIGGFENHLIASGNQSDFVANYAKNAKKLQSFSFSVSAYKGFSAAQKTKRHKIYAQLLSYLENKQFKFRGKISPSDYSRETEILQDVPGNLYSQLKNRGMENLIFERRMTTLPGSIANALICKKLAEQFTETELKMCGIFVKIRGFDLEGNQCEEWRLDIDPRYARQGFFLPMFQDGMITSLRVFRFPNDKRPFTLRARAEMYDFTEVERGSIA